MGIMITSRMARMAITTNSFIFCMSRGGEGREERKGLSAGWEEDDDQPSHACCVRGGGREKYSKEVTGREEIRCAVKAENTARVTHSNVAYRSHNKKERGIRTRSCFHHICFLRVVAFFLNMPAWACRSSVLQFVNKKDMSKSAKSKKRKTPRLPEGGGRRGK